MSDFTITIIGTGVIGTSLGLALKQVDDAPQIVGHDKELAYAQAAAKMGAMDKVEWNLVKACEKADLIILAIPADGIRPTLEAIAGDLKEGVVISDTSRSKAAVMALAQEVLPTHAHFVGGNPIVASAWQGHENANAELFKEHFYCLTPAPTTDESAVQLMSDFINLVGARPFFLDALEHDGLMATVEHLPIALGVTLVNTLSTKAIWREIRKVAGPMFEKTTSGAAGRTEGVVEDMLANKENLLRWIDDYTEQLAQFRTLLAETDDDKEELISLVDNALVERHNWRVDYEHSHFTDPLMQPVKVETPGLMKRLLGIRR